jgi:ubiquitin-protein ligase
MDYGAFSDKPTLSRLNKEICILNSDYNCKILNNNNNINIYIPIVVEHCKQFMVSIIVNKYYPFKQPDIFINNIKYSNILKNISIKYNFTDKCLCCESITCPNKWKPSYKLELILTEIMKYYNDIINFLPADEYD